MFVAAEKALPGARNNWVLSGAKAIGACAQPWPAAPSAWSSRNVRTSRRLTNVNPLLKPKA